MSFANLKKNAGTAGLKNLQEELEKLNKKSDGGASEEEKFWKLATDKSGVGAAVIRFLPAAEGDELPWVLVYEHAFKGPGGWYIEKSRTTLGKNVADPVFEYNNQLWNSGVDANKEIARKQKRTPRYVSNILVVKDPANPENEGKVFLFKYGKKIFDKITEAMQPEFEDESPIDPFDFWQGANFKLKAKNVAGYRNYDSSEFASQSALLDDDDALEAIWKKQYSLADFMSPSEFKTYEELKKRLSSVLGAKNTRIDEEVDDEENYRGPAKELDDDLRSELNNLKPTTRRPVVEEDEDDDALSYFARLAED